MRKRQINKHSYFYLIAILFVIGLVSSISYKSSSAVSYTCTDFYVHIFQGKYLGEWPIDNIRAGDSFKISNTEEYIISYGDTWSKLVSKFGLDNIKKYNCYEFISKK